MKYIIVLMACAKRSYMHLWLQRIEGNRLFVFPFEASALHQPIVAVWQRDFRMCPVRCAALHAT
jgi:hypothetical protein